MKELQEITQLFTNSSFGDYRSLTPGTFASAGKIAKKMKELPVIHVNATPRGGGVAELLKSQVAYERELGLDSHWLVIKAPRSFFEVTKKIHNLLQGRSGGLNSRELAEYLSLERQAKKSFLSFLRNFNNGIVVLHDPQTLPLINVLPKRFSSISRLHIDLSSPNPVMLDTVRPMIKKFKRVIVSNKRYARNLPWIPAGRLVVSYPAINPFSEKNRSMNLSNAEAILKKLGLDTAKPIVAQVSRFDLWKDPLGVIDAYRITKKKMPSLQLILAGLITASDDTEAGAVFAEVKKYSNHDAGIFLFEDPKKLKGTTNEMFVSAIYTASTIIVQKSAKEGFGLTMTEAMWKGRPVVAGRTSGSLIQIRNGKNGLIADSTEKTAEEIMRLLKNESLRKRLGKAAYASVKKRFLMSRFVLDNLKVYESLRK